MNVFYQRPCIVSVCPQNLQTPPSGPNEHFNTDLIFKWKQMRHSAAGGQEWNTGLNDKNYESHYAPYNTILKVSYNEEETRAETDKLQYWRYTVTLTVSALSTHIVNNLQSVCHWRRLERQLVR